MFGVMGAFVEVMLSEVVVIGSGYVGTGGVTGKTKLVLNLIERQHNERMCCRWLVIVPTTLVQHWVREWDRWKTSVPMKIVVSYCMDDLITQTEPFIILTTWNVLHREDQCCCSALKL